MENSETVVETEPAPNPETGEELTWAPNLPQDTAEEPSEESTKMDTTEASSEESTKPDPSDVTAQTPEEAPVTPLPASSSDVPQWLIESEPRRWTDQWIAWKSYKTAKCYLRRNIPLPDFWGPYRPRILENHAFVRRESDFSMAIVVVVSLKGGGAKTTTTTWDGAEDSELTSGLTLIVDADSSGIESAAERLSISTDPAISEFFLSTPQVADKILNRNWVPTSEQLVYFTAKHEASRVRVLTMDTSDLSRSEMAQMLRALKPATHSIYVDTTPGLKEQNTYGAIDAATLVVVSTIYDNTSAINAAKQTLRTAEYGLQKRLAAGDDVVLAIHGVEPKDFNPRFQYEQAAEFGLKPDQVSLFPMDKYAFKARPVDRSKVSERYLFALSEHRRRCAEAAIRWNEKYPMNPLPGDDEATDLLVAAKAAANLKAERRTINRKAEKLARKMVRQMNSNTSVSQPAAETNGDTNVTLEGSAQ